MDVERIIGEIEQLQEMFEAPDIGPLSASDISAAIKGTTKHSRIARGFSFGSGTEFVAEANPKAGFGFWTSAALPQDCWQSLFSRLLVGGSDRLH
jgi:hypothetical protein